MQATIPTQNPEHAALTGPEIIVLGRDFLKVHKLDMEAYVDESNKDILVAIGGATDFWLDNVIDGNGTTIRQYILGSLQIPGSF